MKRALAFLALSALAAGLAFAEDVEYSTLTPKTAKSMAMGGVFTAVPTAEFSFFGNPAAFASQKGTLILPTIDAWTYVRPSGSNLSNLAKSLSDGSAVSTLFGLMAQNGGTGGGASTGLGFAGKGLGVGVFGTADVYVEGTNPASAIVHADAEATAVVGLGIPLQLGALRLSVGGDLRPFYRVSLSGADHQSLALADLLQQVQDKADVAKSIYADAFFGAALDLGATLQLSSLTLGLSIRDIAPSYPMAYDTLYDLGKTLSTGSLPDTSSATDKAVFVPDVTAGLAWSPAFLPGLVDPSVYFELQDPVSVFKNSDGAGSALNLLHVGAEVKFLSFIYLRGGVNRGWLSAGAGVKLLFLDANVAVFSEELGALPGDNPRAGLALQAAIRF